MIGPETQADARDNFGEKDVGDPVQRCATGPTKYHVRLVQMAGKDFPTVVAAGTTSTTHDLLKNVSRASRDQILEQMRDSEDGDIFTSDTHTYKPVDFALGVVGWALSTGMSDVIFGAEIIAALNKGSSPTAVVIIGCRSFDVVRLLIPRANIKVGLGVETMSGVLDINSVKASKAAEAVTEALMLGKTIAEAASAGTTWIVSDGHTIESSLASGVDAGKSLRGNGLL